MNVNPFAWMKKPPTKTLEEDVADDALGLERDILHKELQTIDHKHDVLAKREKLAHLTKWLESRNAA